MRTKKPALWAIATTVGLLLSACGSPSLSGGSASPAGSSSATVAPVAADPALHDKLPDRVKSSGTIIVGVDATYKPNEYLDSDGKTVIGMDVELFDAVAARMGVKTSWQPSAFNAILSGIQANKYDVGVSSFTINTERKKSVNMVSYLNAGTLWAVPVGNPKKIDPKSVCGQTIAVQTGTVQEDEMKAAQEKCPINNKITVLSFGDQGQVNNAVISGRAGAMLADSPITNFAIKQSNNKIEALGEVTDSAPYGFVVSKSNTAFADAIAQATRDIKKSGQYDAILAKYGQENSATDQISVNP
ncbi:ABC transporter substrate-binding protein [Nigerium massiliense]|uniref:ABC transporter substrate-binding protein n=1 Tax=Nigerium massiliense TaxID=1522317 RepID=UPI00058FD98D|nr:ABC transporter substrate-binding protein [Nigerium massiliense]